MPWLLCLETATFDSYQCPNGRRRAQAESLHALKIGTEG